MHDANRDLHEFFGRRFLEQLPSSRKELSSTKPANTQKRKVWSRLGVLQMSELGDRANYIVALAVLAWLLTDSLGAWL